MAYKTLKPAKEKVHKIRVWKPPQRIVLKPSYGFIVDKINKGVPCKTCINFSFGLSRIRSQERDKLIKAKVETMYNAATIVNQVIARNPDLWETWRCKEPDFKRISRIGESGDVIKSYHLRKAVELLWIYGFKPKSIRFYKNKNLNS